MSRKLNFIVITILHEFMPYELKQRNIYTSIYYRYYLYDYIYYKYLGTYMLHYNLNNNQHFVYLSIPRTSFFTFLISCSLNFLPEKKKQEKYCYIFPYVDKCTKCIGYIYIGNARCSKSTQIGRCFRKFVCMFYTRALYLSI